MRKGSVSGTICNSWSLSLETCWAAVRTASMNCRVFFSFNTHSSFCCFNTLSLLSAFLCGKDKKRTVQLKTEGRSWREVQGGNRDGWGGRFIKWLSFFVFSFTKEQCNFLCGKVRQWFKRESTPSHWMGAGSACNHRFSFLVSGYSFTEQNIAATVYQQVDRRRTFDL